ncbi:MAG: HAD family hydrolase [Candidatus Bathycorpusculaceae bacterium]
MKDVVFLDFFGTLVSTPKSLFVGEGGRTWLLLKKYGYEIELDVFKKNWESCLNRMEEESNVSCVEFHFFDFVRAFLRENFPSKPASFRFVKLLAETFLWEWNQGVKWFNESKRVIQKLSKNHRLGIISNTHYSNLISWNLTKAGLTNAFNVIVTSVEYGLKKPDHRIFEYAASQLHVKPRDCVYVGDNPTEDYEGAIGAGMKAVLIDREDRYHNFAGRRIKTLEELIPCLASNTL